MNIVVIEPRKHFLQHRVRGSGFYLENLKRSLLKYDRRNNYLFPKERENIPEGVDLIHYPYFEPFFLTLPILKKVKTIVTVHDLTPLVFPQYFPKGLLGSIKWMLQRTSLKNIDSIITDSKSSKGDILKYVGLPDEKINVVYLAAAAEFKPIKNARPESNIKTKYNLPEKFVLYVGDVTWNKNLPRLVTAIKEINVTLVMVGETLTQKNYDKNNSWNQDLVKIQQMCKDDKRFIKLGFVEKKDLVALYNAATIFTMPSLYEGFGLPVLEAMSCGCPVVTSKEGSIPEVASDAAFYVDAYNVSSISEGIMKIFSDDKLRNELSKKGFIQAKKFSWEKVALETIRIYESI